MEFLSTFIIIEIGILSGKIDSKEEVYTVSPLLIFKCFGTYKTFNISGLSPSQVAEEITLDSPIDEGIINLELKRECPIEKFEDTLWIFPTTPLKPSTAWSTFTPSCSPLSRVK